MKKLYSLFILFVFLACTKQIATEQKKDCLYFVTVKDNSTPDTLYINKPERLPESWRLISRVSFCNKEPFCGLVTKYDNRPTAKDNSTVMYQTEDLGVIYSLNITTKSYRRLHSTNDSIERRISEYIDRILSRSSLVLEGDIPPIPR